MSDETVNVGLLRKMLANSEGAADVYATTTALSDERLAVTGVAHCELPNGEHVCVLLCKRIDPRIP